MRRWVFKLTLNGGFEFQRLGILYRFAIVASEYNSVIMDRLIEGAKRTLKDHEARPDDSCTRFV